MADMEHNNGKKSSILLPIKNWFGAHAYGFKVILPVILGVIFAFLSFLYFILYGIYKQNYEVYLRPSKVGVAFYEQLANEAWFQFLVLILLTIICFGTAIYFDRKE